MGPARRALRRTASTPGEISDVQKEVAKQIEELHKHLDELQARRETSRSADIDASEMPTYWEKVNAYINQGKDHLRLDAVHLISDVLGLSAVEAEAWVDSRLDIKNVPHEASSTEKFTGNVLQFNYGQKGQWRGQPSNTEIRKIAKSIASSIFRCAGASGGDTKRETME
jgi:hypothetical protein